ncbi:MAG: glutamyl-tRNA reductase [Candidatus Rokubacteria bacterium GWC2_70_16]|nr:MAG: glutamyl-tRNA reductase [Candidatus Rokubacteria bacterium GWC2_70_16]OGL19572.1 MAG: glutamyl-tRNA reductase [Candidatus Rokubacteria bacterium RIFCSPLOWO2_12_FULL_71_19]
MATLFVAGMNHRSAGVELREQLALEEDKLRGILADLNDRGLCAEVMILSTCNRVEVYGLAEAPGEARAAAFRALGAARGVSLAQVEPCLYHKTESEAVLHAFRVAASLDSMILGEPQILGQVKDAFALAQSCRTVGPTLHALMTQAFSVAKRIRTETEVGRHAVSASYAAVELARKIFGSLEDKAVLLVGAGEMGELAARHLMEQGAMPVYVANRTWSRAQDLAQALSGTAVPYEQFPATMAAVDVVITSTAAPEPIVRALEVDRALHSRRHRPLFFIDLAVPRNVEPAVNDLEGAFCYDVDDLRLVVEANLRERHKEAQRAEALVEREVAKFAARLRDLEVVPTIVSLREKLETIRLGELDKALSRLPAASDETRQVMEALSQAIVNKVLHAPIVKLKDSTRQGHHARLAELISELFGLRRPQREREP